LFRSLEVQGAVRGSRFEKKPLIEEFERDINEVI